MSKLQSPFWQQQLNKTRKVRGRIVIEGDLVLETPTRFGNGDREGLVDMTISRDAVDRRPLLPGASITGALRSYLRTREVGYRKSENTATKTKLLFGDESSKAAQDRSSSQSYFIAYDSLAEEMATELRDGVAIDPKTRTAIDDKKYDWELLAAGTLFPLRIELLVANDVQADLETALAMALQGFERGEIPMGARRRRGFGKCRVHEWRVRRYDFTQPNHLIAWLREDPGDQTPVVQTGTEIAALLGVENARADSRAQFTMQALFGIPGSLLIRSGTEEAGAPDMVHLRSQRNGIDRPIISGTSLAGALRARALRIANTLSDDEKRTKCYIDDLFGPYIEGTNDTPAASRLWVEESVIENPQELVVSRVKIDRFTGGSFPTALFSQQPVFGTDETAVCLALRVDTPTDADKGLLLLLLKDLWTEDLPLGGEASVGRGRLRGKRATLVGKAGTAAPICWQIEQDGEQLAIQGDRDVMQACVEAFGRRVRGEDA